MKQDSRNTADIGDARQQLISEIYEVALRPELYGHLIDLWETQINHAVSKLKSLDDAASSSSHFDDPEIEEHFHRAYQILEQMGRSAPRAHSATAFVERESSPTLILDSSGTILAANKGAVSTFGSKARLSDLAPDILPADMRELEVQLLRLDRPQAAVEVHVFPVATAKPNSNAPSELLFIARAVQLVASEPAMMAISALSIAWSGGLANLLIRSFSLTSSEVDIVHDLAEGIQVKTIAQLRRRSVHTVRTQLKTILSKTGSSSQSDLIRTVSILSSYANQGAVNVTQREKLLTGTRLAAPVAKGRQLPVNLIGPKNGQPVLFIHGMLDGFAFGKPIAELMEKFGIRLIAPSRPGFGDSPLAYDKRKAPQEFAADLQQLMDYLELPQCNLFGHMAGAVYAFAAASQLGSRIGRVVSVSGAVPITSLKQFSSMSSRQRVVAWTARFAPALLPTILRAGIAQIDAGGEEAFMEALYAESRLDRMTLKNSSVRAAVTAGYHFAVAQGHRAFDVDSVHVTRNWSEYVENVSQPVTLIHGRHDPVVSIESVRAFADRYENFSLVELENCGQLALFQEPEAIFQTLASFNSPLG